MVKLETGKPRNPCRDCTYARNRKRYSENPDVRAKHKVLRDRWRADNPTYSRENYLRNREKRIADAIDYQKHNPVDPEYRRQREKRWRQANAERHSETKRVWRENNAERVAETRRRVMSRRRARLRGLPTESYTMDQLLERDGTKCVLCGEELDLDAVYPEAQAPTVEHLEPIAWPNSAGDVLTNVSVAHYGCNNQRRTRPHPAAAQKRAELLAARPI